MAGSTKDIAEKSLIGALLIRPQLPDFEIDEYVLGVRPRAIYRSIRACFEAGQTPPDLVTVRAGLAKDYQDQVTLAYLADALESVPRSANAKHYYTIIAQEDARLTALDALEHLRLAIEEGDAPARQLEMVDDVKDRIERRAIPDPPLNEITLDGTPQPVPWIIPGLIARADTCILAGEPATGKSYLALDLAIALATGSAFLHDETLMVAEPVRVLYIDEEMAEMMAHRRLELMAAGRHLDTLPELRYFVANRLQLDNPKQWGRIAKVVREFQPGLIVVDTLRRTFSGDENSSEAVSAYFANCVRPLVAESGPECASLTLHHLAKPSKDKSSRVEHRLRGSGDLHGIVDQLLGLEGDTETPIRNLKHLKNRWGQRMADRRITYVETPSDAVIRNASPGEASTPIHRLSSRARAALAVVESASVPIRVPQVVSLGHMSTSGAAGALKELVDAGLILRSGSRQPPGYSYSIPEPETPAEG